MDRKDLEKLATAEYWDERYKTIVHESEDSKSAVAERDKEYEWFQTFAALWPWLQNKLMEPKEDGPSIIHLGNGTSLLPPSLYSKGYTIQTSIDFSSVCTEEMAKQYPFLTWIVGDVTAMPDIVDKSFDVAIDKGTVDAMLGGGSLWPGQVEDVVLERVGKYSSEVFRILKEQGIWIYITYRQPHFIKPLLSIGGFWDIEVETIAGETGTGAFEYFGYILRKRKI